MDDVLSYKLNYKHTRVGSYTITCQSDGSNLKLSAECLLNHNGIGHTIEQHSQCHYPSFRSHYFEEITQIEGQKRYFTIKCNRLTGLVHASRRLNGEDETSASVPYLEPYSDALALIMSARYLSEQDTTYQRVPMLGKTVLIQRMSAAADVPLTRVKGLSTNHYEAPIYHYSISPGGAGGVHIYVSSLAPYPILCLYQPYEGYMLEATLEHYANYTRKTPKPRNSESLHAKERRRDGKRGRRRTSRRRRAR